MKGSFHYKPLSKLLGFPVSKLIKDLPAMKEIWVRPLGQEDALEKEMTTHSRVLIWRLPWTEEQGRLLSMGSQELDTT